ncbi:MAG: methyltransferase domain-containing protein [candidate division Zixibacteria bacterium]|nr:methyltransferase domain-containing protein [candidate division Zixibacteria bacterium]
MSRGEERPELTADGLQNIARAYHGSRIILTAYELGIFTALADERKTSAEVAEALGADPRATDRLMNALAVLGLLNKGEGLFANTAVAARYLVKGKPDYMAGLMHGVHLWDAWSTLTDAVRAGTSVFERPGGEAAERRTEAFIAAMHYNAAFRAGRLVALLDLAGVSRVLDVGGGSGIYAMAFVRAREGITATVFDLPQVTPLTRRYVEVEGLSGKIDIVAGDANVDELPRGYELVLVSQLIHSNSPEENAALINNCAASLNAGGCLVVQDFVVDGDRAGPPRPIIFALNMLVATEAGDTYTEAEIRGWMEAAGLSNIERVDTDFETTLVMGTKP